MLPSEILHAIPRQKVRMGGFVYNVLGVNPDNTMILQLADMTQKDRAMQTWSYAKPEDCEPVPEEPRPFRVGDKVAHIEYEELGDELPVFCTVNSIQPMHMALRVFTDHGIVILNWNENTREYEGDLRHATPEEIAKYFNSHA